MLPRPLHYCPDRDSGHTQITWDNIKLDHLGQFIKDDIKLGFGEKVSGNLIGFRVEVGFINTLRPTNWRHNIPTKLQQLSQPYQGGKTRDQEEH
jgi:hypothetical protein